jgi:predicted phosphodiesterase
MTAIIGDIHADIETLFDIADGLENWIQIGDLGWGFTRDPIPEFPDGGKAIRGNHDCPDTARAHPSYLGDYGVTDDGIFYVSGGCTPDFDRIRRTPGRDWWPDEELGWEELQEMISAYEAAKPDIVVTHDAPYFLYRALLAATSVKLNGHIGDPNRNRTASAFDSMFAVHRPKFWYFGHWHLPFAYQHQGTWFRCVDINEVVIAGHLD